MKLENHIATQFLTNDNFVAQMVEKSLGSFGDGESIFDTTAAKDTLNMLSRHNQKAYYITDTVMDKLELLHVKRSAIMELRKQNSEEIISEIEVFDWSIFYKLKNCKITFILPANELVRLYITDSIIWMCLLRQDSIEVTWCFSYIDKKRNTLSQNWLDVNKSEEFIFKMLCFFFLSENEEILIQPGGKTGTRKSGKVINTLPVPVTIVNSRWNVTTMRTEGFPVSGHFRLQPTKTGVKMIMIDPYMKHGYVRHARNESNL